MGDPGCDRAVAMEGSDRGQRGRVPPAVTCWCPWGELLGQRSRVILPQRGGTGTGGISVVPGVTAVGFGTDHRVPLLRGPAEQVGAADLPPRVHEEPPRLPPRAPGTRLALPHLHVHARGVGPSRGGAAVGTHWGRRGLSRGVSPAVPGQAGAAGVQRPPAADDRGAPGDGARHPAHQLPLPGRGAGRWVRCPQGGGAGLSPSARVPRHREILPRSVGGRAGCHLPPALARWVPPSLLASPTPRGSGGQCSL